MLFSASARGFYTTDIHTPEQIPQDAVEITDDVYQQMMDGEEGKTLGSDGNGHPILKTHNFLNDLPIGDLPEIKRNQRNQILRDCDWVDLPHSPLYGNQAWLDYRQALRDIPTQKGFPKTIVWPIKPELE